MSQLSGKVALVTGASAGLGAATARLFAERGATVFGIARDATKMAQVFADVPGGAFASVDISSREACAAAVADCVERFGRLDVLANIAGFHRMRHTASMTDDDWDVDLAVNLTAPFALCRAALPHLLASGGNIVNVSSNQVLARSLNTTYKARGVHVSAVAPGFTRTEFHQRMKMDISAFPGFLWLGAPFVVKRSLLAVEAGRAVSIPSFRYKVLVAVAALLPKRFHQAGN